MTLGLVMALYVIVLGFWVQARAAGRRLLRDDALVASRAGMALRLAWIAAALVLLFAVRTSASGRAPAGGTGSWAASSSGSTVPCS
ncbi:MAG: hypothetical protein IH993_05915 [Proteobacteria bacterium]|nr:hypothetical protein [Pseudomonadota bacterium]